MLIKFKFPQKIKYDSIKNIYKQPDLYKLENFNIMKSKKGLEIPNIFALKLISEQKDIIIATPSKYHLFGWLNAFYDLFSN